MTEETLTDEHTDDKPENKEKKKPIPRDVSGVGYISTSGTIRYCKTGIDIPLPVYMAQALARAVLAAKPANEIRICGCGCGREITGRATYAIPACRKSSAPKRSGMWLI